MKIAILFLCSIFGILNAQNKNLSYIQKNIEPCRIPINDSISVYKIQEKIYNNTIEIMIKTENLITQECSNVTIDNQLLIKLNTVQNPFIEINKYIIEDINIKDFKNLIPNKIYGIKKAEYYILVIELYSFSYSTIGSGYIYLCFKIDLRGNVIENKMLELKTPMKMNRYNKIF
ncbi:hypothetical protein [Flavobacterium sp. PS2]|uniref:hypothetical protein n=1 Tax=Flavobacterium sp. PS2 TaxID=3384157 RepID=UPI00390C46A7